MSNHVFISIIMCETIFKNASSESPAVSVIIPIYKAEQWIRRALDSIYAQTLQNWECILVDDGSPDRCGEICDEYARKDNRFRVIHQTNSGVSCARQAGLDAARGEYSIHVDPDDWVESAMLEELYSKAKSEDSDMVICDFFEHKDGIQNYIGQKPFSLDPMIVLEQIAAISPKLYQLYGSCCNKLVRRSCYNSLDNQIRYEPQDLSFGEDLLFNCRLLQSTVKRISYLNRAFYHYDVHGGSLTFTIGRNIQYLIEIMETVIKNKDLISRIYLKPIHLQLLFTQKEFRRMKMLYPETQAIIKSKYPHSILVLALKGYPRIAYLCYKLKLFYKK